MCVVTSYEYRYPLQNYIYTRSRFRKHLRTTRSQTQPQPSMAKQFIGVLAALLLFSSALATSDVPFVVAHKKTSLTRLKTGAERVSVVIDIYNQGSSTAYDVSLNDDDWPTDTFDVVTGNTSKSWEKLDASAIVSHKFELEAKVKGVFYGTPAVITFRIPTNSALQEAFSTPAAPLDILADRPAEKKFEWAKRLLAKYGGLISVISIMVLFVHLVASPSGSAKANKKRR